jgi:hypothetical protein
MSRLHSAEAELSLRIEPKIKRSCLAARFEQQGPVNLHASFAYLSYLSEVSSTRRFALGFAFHYETPHAWMGSCGRHTRRFVVIARGLHYEGRKPLT